MKKKLKEAIHFLNQTDDYSRIKEKLIEIHPADLSLIFEKLDKELRVKVYNSLDGYELALLFSYLDNPLDYLEELDFKQAVNILDNMEVDDVSNILSDIDDEELKTKYLNNLSEKEALNYIAKIKEDRVGSIISTNYIDVEAGVDVKVAMRKLIKEASESELIDPIFVTKNHELVGIISLNDLIIARSPKIIDEIMDHNPISIDINDSINNATSIISNYSLNALPVTDNDKLVGIITSDDAFEIYSDIADKNYASLAGVSSDDLADKRFFKRLLERLPWLIFLLVLSILTTNVISIFEGIIQQITILVFFQTLILDMSGNVGTQSLASTIQAIIQNDNMNKTEIIKHINKEVKINIINSVFLMVIAFIVSFIFITIYGSTYPTFKLSLVISIAMGITLIISAFFGSMLPIFFSKIKINPAVASGPLITTLNDIISILIYFNLAALLLNITF